VCAAVCGSMASVVSLVKHASTGLAEYGIRVNALAPGCACCPAPRLSILLLIAWWSFRLKWLMRSSREEILVRRVSPIHISSLHEGLEGRRRWVGPPHTRENLNRFADYTRIK
jgi:NAD(P)-dependent dehydrogenase (short-subunit alcohol dehydrogenase family)